MLWIQFFSREREKKDPHFIVNLYSENTLKFNIRNVNDLIHGL